MSRMDRLVNIRSLYQFQKWKWLLVVGLVTVTHLLCQSLMLPYGNALLSLLPDAKFTVNEKVGSTPEKSVVVGDPSNVNVPNLVEESLLTRSIERMHNIDSIGDTGDDDFSVVKESENKNEVFSESKGIDNELDFVEDVNVDNDMPFKVGGNNDTGSMERDDDQAGNTSEFKQSLSLEQVVKPSDQVLSDKMGGSRSLMKLQLREMLSYHIYLRHQHQAIHWSM